MPSIKLKTQNVWHQHKSELPKMDANRNSTQGYYSKGIQFQVIGYNCNEEYTLKLVLIFCIRALMPIITLFSYQYITSQSQNQSFLWKQLHQILINYYKQIQIIAAICNIIVVLIIFYFCFHKKNQGSKMSQLTKLQKAILQVLQFLIELNLHFSALMCVLNMNENISLLSLASLMTIYSCMCLENYIERFDLMYCSSAASNYFFKGWMCFQYIMMAILVHLEAKTMLAVLFSILAIVLMIWMIRVGLRMYVHEEIINSFIVIVSLYCSAGLKILLSMVFEQSIDQIHDLIQILLLFVILVFVFKIWSQRQLQRAVKLLSTDASSIHILDLLSFDMESWEKQSNESILLQGFMTFHEAQNCSNTNCFSHQYSDAKQQKADESKQNKLMLKCYYQRMIETHFDADLTLRYCEFIFNEFRNVTILLKQFTMLQSASLTVVQRMQILRMKKILIKENEELNKSLYNGNLNIEDLIASETSYKQIQDKIKGFIQINVIIWQTITMNEVDLSYIRKNINLCNQIQQNINENWNVIKKYFSINKVWRFTYICFLFLIQNKKLKMKQIDDFGLQPSLNNIFKEKNIFIDQQKDRMSIKSQEMLFDSKTCFLHAVTKNNSLLITKVSQHFQKNMKYKQKEIIGCSIDLLLPFGLRQKHFELFTKWSKEGSAHAQNTYIVQSTGCVTGQGIQIPVLKYYKTLFNLHQRDIEYVCMLKINEKQIRYESDSSTQILLNNQMNHDASNQINFSPDKNIFYKEETFEAVKQIIDIRQTKWIMRVYILVLMMTVFILAELISAQSQELIAYSQQYITFMQIYRLPMILGVNYYKSLLKIGNASKIASDVVTNIKLLTDMASSSYALKTLFNQRIYTSSHFYPTDHLFSGTPQVDQVELFFLMQSSLVSLSKLPVNESSIDFLSLRNHILPNFNTLMNRTKNQIHYSFSTIFYDIKAKHITAAIIQGFIAFLFTAIAYCKINHFFSKMKSIIETILTFHPQDLEKIMRYWHFAQHFFQQIRVKNQESMQNDFKVTTEISLFQKRIFQSAKHSTINMNKRNKILQFSRQFSKLKIKLFLPSILMILIASIIIIAFEINIINKFEKLIVFEESGYQLTKFFPCFPILSYGIMQKSHSLLNPLDTIFSSQRYQEIISAAELFTNMSYLEDISNSDSQFYIKQKNYLEVNPCTFNPSIITKMSIKVSECQKFLNASFTRGIGAAMRITKKLSQSHIRGKSMMNYTQINEFTVSTSVLSNYMFDLIASWGSEFHFQVEDILTINFNIISVSLAAFLYLIFEVFFVRQFRREYGFYRYAFNRMVPQFILIKEKVIKQKFIIDQIITNA